MIPVSSSNIASVGYSQENEILTVEFIRGEQYEYYDVPEYIYRELMSASSHGSYFNMNIRNAFSYNKV